MKNIILTILLSVISFSFAQSDIKMSESMQKKNTELKKMAVKAVDYLDNQLKLSSKQKTVLTNEYSRYANALIRAQVKNIRSLKFLKTAQTIILIIILGQMRTLLALIKEKL